jgi:D-sedoheptulose 7-phosphate isomerase
MTCYNEQVLKTLTESRDFLERFIADAQNIAQISKAAELMIACLRRGNAIYSCGNGGSMSDAMHFAEELTGRFRGDRPGLAATAISDPGHISCVANDYGYEQVFSRYLEARARAGDCLLAISTSGRSANVLAAAKFARQRGIAVISLSGAAQSPLSAWSDAEICAGASDFADRIQEIHIKVIHTLIELIERDSFPQNY